MGWEYKVQTESEVGKAYTKPSTKATVRIAKRKTGRTTGKTAKARHKIKPISTKQRRAAVKKGQLRVRKSTLEVRKAISQRGRTHPMEAALPGMPESAQALTMDSTAIKRFKYDVDAQILRIWFVSNHVYDYYEVPESVVLTLAQAQSKGRYFYYNVRTDYKFKRIR